MVMVRIRAIALRLSRVRVKAKVGVIIVIFGPEHSVRGQCDTVPGSNCSDIMM